MGGYKKIEDYDLEKTNSIAQSFTKVITDLGENINREGLEKTPERVAKSLQFLTHGYDLDPIKIINSAIFNEDHNQMVIVKDVELYSMCEHHMLPFFWQSSHCIYSSRKNCWP